MNNNSMDVINIEKINIDIVKWLIRDDIYAYYKQLSLDSKKELLFSFENGHIILDPPLCDKFLNSYPLSQKDEKMRMILYRLLCTVNYH